MCPEAYKHHNLRFLLWISWRFSRWATWAGLDWLGSGLWRTLTQLNCSNVAVSVFEAFELLFSVMIMSLRLSCRNRRAVTLISTKDAELFQKAAHSQEEPESFREAPRKHVHSLDQRPPVKHVPVVDPEFYRPPQ